MTSVAVLVPVLNRPERVKPLVESIRQDERATPVFLCSPDDEDELAAVSVEYRRWPVGTFEFHIVDWPCGAGDYARKINYGMSTLTCEWALLAADDLVFHDGWLDACLHVHEQTGACVIGTNDLGNGLVMQGRHATHSLVHRDYLACGTVDEPGKLLHEGYDHNYCDVEFVETAMWRGTFAPARTALVEHLHHLWRKGEDDATYAKGRERYHEDRALFERRRRLWAA